MSDEDARPSAPLVNQEYLGEHDDAEDREEHHHDEEAHVRALPVPERDVLLLGAGDATAACRPHHWFSAMKQSVPFTRGSSLQNL